MWQLVYPQKRESKLSNINVFLEDLIAEEKEEYNIRQHLWICFSDILWFRNSQTVSGSVLLVNLFILTGNVILMKDGYRKMS